MFSSPATSRQSPHFRSKSHFRACVLTTTPRCLTKSDRHTGWKKLRARSSEDKGRQRGQVVGTVGGGLGSNLKGVPRHLR